MIRRFLSSQLRRNVASGIVAAGLDLVVLAVSYPVYLHFLGYERLGLWFALVAVVMVAQLGNFGVTHAVTKLVAEEHGRGDLRGAQSFVLTGVLFVLTPGTVAAVAIVLFRGQILSLLRLSTEQVEVVAGLMPFIALLCVYALSVDALNGALAGMGRMDQTSLCQVLARVVLAGVSIVLLVCGFGIEGMLIATFASYVVRHAATHLLLRRLGLRVFRWSNFDLARLRRILGFGMNVFGGSLASLLLAPFNRLVLTRYAGPAAVPVLDIAFNGCARLRMLLTGGLAALMPEVSRLSARPSEDWLEPGESVSAAGGTLPASQASLRERIVTVNRRALRLILFLGVPGYALLFLLAEAGLKLWLGPTYVPALPGTFRVILVGSFLSLLAAPAFFTLLGLGRSRDTMLGHVSQSGLSVLTIAGLLVIYGTISVTGVASAVSLGCAGATLLLLLRYRWAVARLPSGTDAADGDAR